MLRTLVTKLSPGLRPLFRATTLRAASTDSTSGSDPAVQPDQDIAYPHYQARADETIPVRRARVLYQCRKRGMLENGILLSCFADRHLQSLTDAQLVTFDTLINKPSNDWDIFNWITGKAPAPPEYESDVLSLLQDFVQNKDREVRLRQPDLKFDN